jgi:hypothetical protein
MLDEFCPAEVLRDLVWQFNLLPSLYCDQSWLPCRLDDGLLRSRSRPDSRVHQVLSPWMLDRFRLRDDFCFDFADPCRRLALLDGQALERLAPATALLARREALRRTLDRSVLDLVRRACRIDEVGFMILDPSRGSPAAQPREAGPLDAAEVARLPARGRNLLLALGSGGRAGVAHRMRLNFPRPLRVRAEPLDDNERAMLAAAIVGELVPRLIPSWTWLFS